MGLEAVYPRKRTTIPGGPSGISPYRLRGLEINRQNQVVCADITYLPIRRGFMYLFAIMDWYSKKILAWELSNTLDIAFCLKCLKRLLQSPVVPEIMNTLKDLLTQEQIKAGTMHSTNEAFERYFQRNIQEAIDLYSLTSAGNDQEKLKERKKIVTYRN